MIATSETTTIPPAESSRPRSRLAGVAGFLLGWPWRILAGAALCFNFPVLSYLTSIAAFGWFYRWMQAIALRGWWKRSKLRDEMTFREFCDSLGPNGPVPRPRLFLQERARYHLNRSARNGRPAGFPRKFVRLLRLPLDSFFRNFALGVQGLFCTYLLTGWGCLMLLFAWEFGWLNSFYKGYEQSFIGPLTGIGGILLFALAMLYVPMAQAHQAVAGEARAFFQFRTVFSLIRASLPVYAVVAVLALFASFPLLATRLAVLSDNFPGNSAATDAEGLRYLRTLLYWSAVLLFVSLLVLRGLTAVAYRSALLKALRRGWIVEQDLPAKLHHWLTRLDIMPLPLASPVGLLPAAAATARFPFRFAVYTFIVAVWSAFMVRYIVSYFFVADGFTGFLNQPLVQFPCMEYVPAHLHQ